MPVFELQDPATGKTFEVEAPDIDSAIGAFKQFTAMPEQQPMSWGDAVSTGVGNIPSSAVRFGENIAHALTHPVETVTNLAKVGYGGLSKGVGAFGVPMDPIAKAAREREFDAVVDFFGDRYGGAENVKRTLAEDPVGMAADVASVLSGVGTTTRVPAISRAASFVDPINAAVRGTKVVGKHVVAPVVGITTGAGGDAVRAAGRAGYQGNRAFVENMRGNAGINDTIDMAQSAMGQMRKERSEAYRSGMEAVKASDTPISYGSIEKAMAEAHERAYYRGVPIDEVAAKTLDEIRAKVSQFREVAKSGPADTSYRAAEGLDALKQAVGEIRQRTQPNTKARSVADHVYNTIKSEITRQVPEYARTMKAYSQASDRLNDLTKTFSLGERAAPDTTARKLQSVMRNNVNTNYGRRTRLMDELARYEPDLPAALAGQTMSSVTPRGLQSLGATGVGIGGITHLNPYAAALLPFFSPRLMGEAAYGIGRGASLLENAPRAVGVNPSSIPPWLLAAYQAGNIGQAAQGGLLALPGAMDAGLLGGN
jgi:hypothetical protein